jgi:hypothetical protein
VKAYRHNKYLHAMIDPARRAGEARRVTGVSNLHVYAAMRGETLDDFLKSRNAKVLYSVSGAKD